MYTMLKRIWYDLQTNHLKINLDRGHLIQWGGNSDIYDQGYLSHCSLTLK